MTRNWSKSIAEIFLFCLVKTTLRTMSGKWGFPRGGVICTTYMPLPPAPTSNPVAEFNSSPWAHPHGLRSCRSRGLLAHHTPAKDMPHLRQTSLPMATILQSVVRSSKRSPMPTVLPWTWLQPGPSAVKECSTPDHSQVPTHWAYTDAVGSRINNQTPE